MIQASHTKIRYQFCRLALVRQNAIEGSAVADDKTRDEDPSRNAPQGYVGQVAADYPDLLQIVESRVKPVRLKDNRELLAKLVAVRRKACGTLRDSRSVEKTLAIHCVLRHMAFAFLPSKMIFANTHGCHLQL